MEVLLKHKCLGHTRILDLVGLGKVLICSQAMLMILVKGPPVRIMEV